jgi:hypothetical protein
MSLIVLFLSFFGSETCRSGGKEVGYNQLGWERINCLGT